MEIVHSYNISIHVCCCICLSWLPLRLLLVWPPQLARTCGTVHSYHSTALFLLSTYITSVSGNGTYPYGRWYLLETPKMKLCIVVTNSLATSQPTSYPVLLCCAVRCGLWRPFSQPLLYSTGSISYSGFFFPHILLR
jgi:hypothetical protein